MVFDRFDAAGVSVLGEVEVARETDVRAGVAVDFSGESYGVAFVDSALPVVQQVAPDGTLVGHATAADLSNSSQVLASWLGSGWGLVWDHETETGSVSRYGVLGSAGETVVPATEVGPSGAELAMVWTGEHVAVSSRDFSEFSLTAFEPDGTTVIPRQVVTALYPFVGRNEGLYQDGGSYWLVLRHWTGGVVEYEILTDGTVTGARRVLTPAGYDPFAYHPAAAFDGATTALLWRVEDLYFQTSACLDDDSPPPCPDLAMDYDPEAEELLLTWTWPHDPESGIWRHDLYRDDTMLAQMNWETLSYLDVSLDPTACHRYELRAMNGACRESEGCAELTLSTVSGDANGDCLVTPSDIFYLIAYLFSGGPPPLGPSDANGDGVVSVADIFYLINYLFADGPPPMRPLQEVCMHIPRTSPNPRTRSTSVSTRRCRET